MKIELGELIAQPIAIMWFHKPTSWSDMIKIHLKNLLVDVKNLREEKTCKSYDVLAFNNLLSIKISNDTLIGKEWYNIFEEVVNEDFNHAYDYEISNVQKKKEMDFA